MLLRVLLDDSLLLPICLPHQLLSESLLIIIEIAICCEFRGCIWVIRRMMAGAVSRSCFWL